MRKIAFLLAAVVLSVGISGQRASAGVDIGVSIGEEGLRSFYMAIGDYYRVPHRDVVVIKERRVRDHEIPVVLFLSQHAHVSPSVIIDMRLRGLSWMSIMFHYRLSPDILYVEVDDISGPPYGKAYGHYKEHKHKKKKWRKKDLNDNDVVNLVNLRFLSEHYHESPRIVIQMREGGRDFVGIHDEVRRSYRDDKDRGGRGDDRDRDRDRQDRDDRDKGNGKDRGKDHDKGHGKKNKD